MLYSLSKPLTYWFLYSNPSSKINVCIGYSIDSKIYRKASAVSCPRLDFKGRVQSFLLKQSITTKMKLKFEFLVEYFCISIKSDCTICPGNRLIIRRRGNIFLTGRCREYVSFFLKYRKSLLV